MAWYYKDKITTAQQHILDILDDGELHPLLMELEGNGRQSQRPAIKALERKGLIEAAIDGGYYTRWRITSAEHQNH